MNKIVVGIGVRNEESNTILAALKSVRKAIKYTKINQIKIVVCLNGNYDNALLKVNEFIKLYPDVVTRILSINLTGVVPAQRNIINNYPADIHIFPDADSIVKKDAFKILLDHLQNNKNLNIVYGNTLPLGNKRRSLIEKVNIVYNSQKFLTKRHYFHGRLFAIRDWVFPDNYIYSKNNYLLDCYGYYLSLDDVYISFYSLDKYGFDSIKEVSDAICYAWPINNFGDWYKIYRRTKVELMKVNLLFPNFQSLLKITKRKTDFKILLKAPLKEQNIWLMYLMINFIYCVFFNIELALFRFRISSKKSLQWETAWSTKKQI